MAKLPDPVGQVLREEVDEQLVRRAWLGMERPKRPQRAPLVLATLAAAAVLGVFALQRPGPLRLEDGAPIALMRVAKTAAPRAHALSDGSRITLMPGSELAPLSSTDSAFLMLLRQGEARFEVKPGGPRRWSIECGLATVEVLGTRFTIVRAPDRVTVSVERGLVLVRGELVPERIQRLAAGESLELKAPSRAAPAGPTKAQAPAHAPRPSASQPNLHATHPRPSASQPSLRPRVQSSSTRNAPQPRRHLAQQRPHRAAGTPKPSAPRASQGADKSQGAQEALSPGPSSSPRVQDAPQPGAAPRTRAVDDPEDPGLRLLQAADQARAAKDHARAVKLLQTMLRAHPEHPSAGLAAFTMGTIELDHLGHPARALRAFSLAIERGLPPLLQEDALARQVEALHRAGRSKEAQRAAERYFERYPKGRRAALVREWSKEQ